MLSITRVEPAASTMNTIEYPTRKKKLWIGDSKGRLRRALYHLFMSSFRLQSKLWLHQLREWQVYVELGRRGAAVSGDLREVAYLSLPPFLLPLYIRPPSLPFASLSYSSLPLFSLSSFLPARILVSQTGSYILYNIII